MSFRTSNHEILATSHYVYHEIIATFNAFFTFFNLSTHYDCETCTGRRPVADDDDAASTRAAGAPVVEVRRADASAAATDLTLAEIAARLGYCNAAYFTNIFRDSEGVAPKEWRKRQHPK